MVDERGAAAAGAGVRVLILDEDRVEGGMLAFHLRREGLIVMLMTSLDEMRDALAWAAPDVLLVDLTSRGFDARELFAVLRAAEQAQSFDIVAFADRALDAELELEALRHGIVDILTKPLDARGLAERVKHRPHGHKRPSELGIQVPEGAIGGDLALLPPLKLLELCLRHRMNARLHVPIERDWAVVVVRQGDVIDAETATATGRTAAIAALRATVGAFVLMPLASDAEELRRDDVVRMDLATLAAEALGRVVAPPKARGLERAPIPTSPGKAYANTGVPKPPPPAYAQPTHPPVAAATAVAAPVAASAPVVVQIPAQPLGPQAAAQFSPSRSFQPVRPAAQIDPASHELPRVVRRDATGPRPPQAQQAPPLQHAPVQDALATNPPEDDEGIFDEVTDQRQTGQRENGQRETGQRETGWREAKRDPSPARPKPPVPHIQIPVVPGSKRKATAPGLARSQATRMSAVTSAPASAARDDDERIEHEPRRAATERVDAEPEASTRPSGPAPRTRLIVMAAAALLLTVFIGWRLASKGGAPAPAALPNDPEIRLALALHDLDAGKRDDARRALAALANEPSPDSAVLATLARIHIEDTRWIEAQGLLETLAERYPGDARVWAWLGIARAERGETQRAVDAFVKAQNASASRPLSEKLARLTPAPKTPPTPP